MLNLWKPNIKFQENKIQETTVSTELIKKYLEGNDDFTFNEFYINEKSNLKVGLAYIEGLVDSDQINETILKPLTQQMVLSSMKSESEIIDLIIHGSVYYSSREVVDDLSKVISKILEGFSALIFEEEKKAIVFETKGFKTRSIDEPTDETVIKGPKDCFIESLRVNTSLVRRSIRTHNLKIEKIEVGEKSKRPIVVMYLDNVVNKDLIKDIKERIQKMKIDNIITVRLF